MIEQTARAIGSALTSRHALALFIMFALGAVLERAFGRARRREDRLNWLYAPIFLAAHIGSAALFFLLFRQLAWRYDIPWLIPVSIGDDSLAGQALALLTFAVLLDLALTATHRLQHEFSALWAAHRLHHSDQVVDVTTSVRLHVVDLVVANIVVAALFAFVIPLPYVATPALMLLPYCWLYYNHLNVEFGHGRLWWLLTSPNFHRLHHEQIERGVGCNFAHIFPVWDLLGGTARRPMTGESVQVGLTGWRPQSVAEMLLEPIGVAGPSAAAPTERASQKQGSD